MLKLLISSKLNKQIIDLTDHEKELIFNFDPESDHRILMMFFQVVVVQWTFFFPH